MESKKINWLVRPAVEKDIPKIQALTLQHEEMEMPYTLDGRLTRAFLDQILVVYDSSTGKIGCFEHVIEAPFSTRDLIFLKAIKQFPYIKDVQSGQLVNCCQSSGIGQGSHRALYEYQAKHWNTIWTWISIKSPLWPLLKELGWVEAPIHTKFYNIWKDGQSEFVLAIKGSAKSTESLTERCGAYAEWWKELDRPQTWKGCSLPKGHEGNHENKE